MRLFVIWFASTWSFLVAYTAHRAFIVPYQERREMTELSNDDLIKMLENANVF
jgi:hypothetical protein